MKRKPPTMADVARRAGVSPMTVSRALRDGTLISEETRRKIREVADALGYVRDARASAFGTGRTGFVAMTIPSINNGNFADTVRGATEALAESGLQLLLGYTNYDVEEEERLVRAFLERRPEAMMVTGGAHTKACRRLLSGFDGPVVETWDLPKAPIGHVVGFSNAEAGRIMARHLFERGYRRIGFIGGAAHADTRGADRRRGFAEALEEFGLATERVSPGRAPTTMREAAAAAHALFDDWPDTDAVMCVSDIAAFGAFSAAQKRGLAVPTDVAIAGFGAYDIAEFTHPQITTLDVGAYEIGRRAADFATLGDAEPGWREVERIDIRLVVRASTGS